MKKQWKRLLIAATTSASVFALTWHWYHSSHQTILHDQNEKPLAYVGKVVEDIQRRPATRLLWQLVNTGEPLYNGEAIRTSSAGEVRILFTDSDRYLDLEPDSLIVIKKSEGEIALDLMEGSLFVNAASSAEKTTSLVLNSATGKVDLSKASASLSKTQGQDVEVQVLTGDASVKSKDGSHKALQTISDIKIQKPSLQKPFFVNGENISPVLFEWEALTPTSQVALLIGSSRKNLATLQSLPAGQNQVHANLKLGKHFWKLVATENGQKIAESPVYRLEVVARFPPTVVFPTAEANLPGYAALNDVTFRWQKGDEPQTVQLTVSKDSDFQNIIARPTFKSEDFYVLKGLEQGTYFWRISSTFADSDQLIQGKVQTFTIKPAEQMRAQLASTLKVQFTPPQTPQQYIQQPEVQLQWSADKLDGIKGWRLKIKEESDPEDRTQVFDLQNLKYTAAVPRAGRYIAFVEALNSEGYVIGSAISSPIDIEMKPLLAAPTFVSDQEILKAESDGRVQLHWTNIPEAKEYRLKILKDGKELRATSHVNLQTALKNLLPGQYDLELRAVDAYGRTSSAVEKRQLLVPDVSNIRAPAVKRIKVD